MKAGLIIFLVGLVLVAYTYINYLWASNKLSQLKKRTWSAITLTWPNSYTRFLSGAGLLAWLL